MNIMTWNIRGMNTNDKISHVFMLLYSHKLSLFSLVETKLSARFIEKLRLKFPAWHIIHNNETGGKGRILILVDKLV